MYILQKLFEGQKTEYKDLFDTLQFYVAPVVNPDGFAFTQSNNRLWRKNRRVNSDNTRGVDLNRNWADHWGGGGASPDPSSDTYRGTAAFSEPETANIAAYIKKIEAAGAVVESAWDVHSYSQLILRPFGWATPDEATPKNDAAIGQLGAEMQKAVQNVHGTFFENIHAAELYTASGGADDWFGTHTAQQKAYTFELRDTGRYGFLLPANQIIPSGEEILPAFVLFARDTLKEAIARRS
jgi:murein tripeptide amidase MpaA